MTVSVIIAAYNCERIIARAVESAVRQTEPPLEIIVADDASTDGTNEALAALCRKYECVRVVTLPVNGGPSKARNAAFRVARGDWLAILDADDEWRPNRLEVLTRMGEAKNADLIADNIILFDEVAGREGRTGFTWTDELRRISACDLFESGIQESSEFSYGLLKPLIRRRFVEDHDVYYDEAIRYAEDFDYYARLLLNGAILWVTSNPLYVYTTKAGEFSKQENPFSKSVPRFDLVAANNARLMEVYGHKMDAGFRQIVVRRGQRLMAIHRANYARQIRQSGNLAAYALFVLRHPDLLSLLLWRTFRRLRRAFQSKR